MNIEDLAQPPKSPEEQAEFDRMMHERMQAAVAKWLGHTTPNVPVNLPEPVQDLGAGRRRQELERVRTEGIIEGIQIAVTLIKQKGSAAAISMLEDLLKRPGRGE